MSKVVLLFPGQGAQFVGMGKGLVERYPSSRDYFDRASRLLDFDLLQLCIEGPESTLNETRNSQPALFVHSVAALEEFRSTRPDAFSSVIAVAGLSLGEYSALYAAGVIGFEEGVRLVRERGEAMQAAADKVPSGMASVIGLETAQVSELCDQARLPGEVLQIANLLCPGNIAISGHKSSLAKAEALAPEMGASRFIPLAVAGAFHTSIMQSASERLTQALQQTDMQPALFELISNVDATAHVVADEFRALLAKQLVSPVLWEQSLKSLLAKGGDQFYEIGAGRVLAGTLKRIERKIPCECFGD